MTFAISTSIYNDPFPQKDDLILINLWMAQTKQNALQVQLNPQLVKQMDVKHSKLRKRYLDEVAMHARGTTLFYKDTNGLDEDQIYSYSL